MKLNSENSLIFVCHRRLHYFSTAMQVIFTRTQARGRIRPWHGKQHHPESVDLRQGDPFWILSPEPDNFQNSMETFLSKENRMMIFSQKSDQFSRDMSQTVRNAVAYLAMSKNLSKILRSGCRI